MGGYRGGAEQRVLSRHQGGPPEGSTMPAGRQPGEPELKGIYVRAHRQCFDDAEVDEGDRCDIGTAIVWVYRVIARRHLELEGHALRRSHLLHECRETGSHPPAVGGGQPLGLAEVEWENRLASHQRLRDRTTKKAGLQRAVSTALLTAAVLDYCAGGNAVELDAILTAQARHLSS